MVGHRAGHAIRPLVHRRARRLEEHVRHFAVGGRARECLVQLLVTGVRLTRVQRHMFLGIRLPDVVKVVGPLPGVRHIQGQRAVETVRVVVGPTHAVLSEVLASRAVPQRLEIPFPVRDRVVVVLSAGRPLRLQRPLIGQVEEHRRIGHVKRERVVARPFVVFIIRVRFHPREHRVSLHKRPPFPVPDDHDLLNVGVNLFVDQPQHQLVHHLKRRHRGETCRVGADCPSLHIVGVFLDPLPRKIVIVIGWPRRPGQLVFRHSTDALAQLRDGLPVW
mmetsp:Transcript_55482/g.132896  ORF Transcript_55482/g.132896 Transcript_55482/m.132896 type:complete len:276 (-) Transcript_55482:489-1316(-)